DWRGQHGNPCCPEPEVVSNSGRRSGELLCNSFATVLLRCNGCSSSPAKRRRVAAARVAENFWEARRLGHEMSGTYIQTLNVGAISFRHPVLLWRRHPAVSLQCAPAGAAGDLCKRAGCCPAVSAGAVDPEAPHLEVESRRGFGRAAPVRRSAGTACAGAHLFCAAYAGRSKKYPADLAAKNQPDRSEERRVG